MKHNYMLISILVVVVFFSISVHSIGLLTEHYADVTGGVVGASTPVKFDVSGSYTGSCSSCSVNYDTSDQRTYLKCICKNTRGYDVVSRLPISMSGVNNINGVLKQ